MKKYTLQNFQPLIFALIAAVGLVVGMRLQSSLIEDKYLFKAAEPNDNRIIYETLQHIDEKYYGTLDSIGYSDAVIRSIVSELDEYSYYWNEKSNGYYHQYLNGAYHGRGFELHQIDSSFYITTVLKASPAAKANLIRGDQIVGVDGDDLQGMDFQELQAKIVASDSLVLTVFRESENANINAILSQAEVSLPLIKSYRIESEDVIYVRIDRFTSNVFAEVMEELDYYKKQGHEVKDLIIDLRDNPGGLLDETVKLLNQMIMEAEIELVSTVDNEGRLQAYKSNGRTFHKLGKIVVLINQNSASASEILAGSLQDLDRAVIMGQHSYGKGLIQQNYRLSNGGSISLTVGEYLLPSGRAISKMKDTTQTFLTKYEKREINTNYGVSPDIKLDDSCHEETWPYHRNDYFNFLIESKYLFAATIPEQDFDSVFDEYWAVQTQKENSCKSFLRSDFLRFMQMIYNTEDHQNRDVSNIDLSVQEAVRVLRDGRYEDILKM